MKISKNTRKVAKAKTKLLLGKQNVVGVGVGEKWSKGQSTGAEAVIVLVKKKIDKAQLDKASLIPAQVTSEGVTIVTDVIEVGELKALAGEENRQKHRPIKSGVSVGHYMITSGTIGLIVEKDGEAYILSNNHVLANSNAAKVGDAIYQPGPADGGGMSDKVAELSAFIPLDYSAEAANVVDCAIAKILVAPPVVEPPPVEPPPPVVQPPKPKKRNFFQKILDFLRSLFGGKKKASTSTQGVTVIIGGNEEPNAPTAPVTITYSNEVLGIGAITGNINTEYNVGDAVQKSGRTTGYTQNKIIAVDVTCNVSYGFNQSANFVGQIVCGDMSDGGDSGSAVFDMNKNLVGLLFAGSDTVTILNPISEVFQRLGIKGVK